MDIEFFSQQLNPFSAQKNKAKLRTPRARIGIGRKQIREYIARIISDLTRIAMYKETPQFTGSPFYSLHSDCTSLVIDCRQNAPAILYWGTRLSATTTPEMLALLSTRQEVPAGPEHPALVALSPEAGAGFPGSTGIAIHRKGKSWGVYAQLTSVEQVADECLTLRSHCSATEIEIVHSLQLHPKSGVLAMSTTLKNMAESHLSVDRCDAPTVPLPLHYDQILGFEGRWTKEFQTHSQLRTRASYVRENRAGRTSHDSFPGVIVHTAQCDENQGGAYGFHLGWSGNHRINIEQLSDGQAFAQLGELFFPGELNLSPNESYQSPTLYCARSNDGLSALSRSFHNYVRAELIDTRMKGKLKPVHFNTWEAMYFELSVDKLKASARAAAHVGIERFVLDDGWFRNRNSDQTSLGDWYVDESVFPAGLDELINYVESLEMEFGLWVEPEMVSPDSDLYRNHPEWALNATPAPLAYARNQLVLDLTRKEVSDYLFERLDSLLSQHNIRYLKWDMNRNLSQPGGADGRALTHYQTLALYALLARVRAAHPSVEIESCSSGGARADFGILKHTDRIWTSDSNDALDRLNIQRGFSFFFPAELMGAHVGPTDCHITKRTVSMASRCAVALFGDMGVEADLLALTADETEELKAAIALHKRHRALIFSGDLVRLDTLDYESGFGIVSPDKTEALFSYALLESPPYSTPGRYKFHSLQADRIYEISVDWPLEPHYYSPSIMDQINGETLSGEALMRMGMQLPLMMPDTLLVIHLKAI